MPRQVNQMTLMNDQINLFYQSELIQLKLEPYDG